ncbi:sterol 26-hydroxylase, mitochondrial-like [Scyliorhinus torazame]
MYPMKRSLLMRWFLLRKDCSGGNGGHLVIFHPSVIRHSANIPVPSHSSATTAKPLQEIPGRSVWSTFYWLFIKGYFHRLHLFQIIEHNKFGPLWRTGDVVNVADNNLIEQVVRQEGKYPMRANENIWKEQRKVRGLANGLITAEGEEWYRLRALLNKRMLKPQEAALYQGVINQVASDLIERIRWLRSLDGSGVMVHNITQELQRYTFEAIAAILFEVRLGCLQQKIPEDTQKFIDSVTSMFRALVYCDLLPKWTRNWLPYWNQYLLAWDNMFDFAIKAVDKKMAQIKELLDTGQSVEGQYLTYILASGQMSQSEMYSSITELLLGGVDTTSNTLSWALYHLAKDQELQDSVFREICSISPAEEIPTAQDVSKMPLLRATIKETLRKYPVVPSGYRVLDTDVVLGGYNIPRRTQLILCHYAMSHNEEDFPSPHLFQPDRWVRGAERLKHHPFSSIPFGYGVRGCPGRRIAELEVHLTLARLLKHFQLKLDSGTEEIPARTRIIMIPENPINMQFLDRH